MRKLLFLFFIFCSSVSFAQTGTFNTIRAYYGGVIGSQLRDPSAMFDIQSNSYGFLAPRMTTTERNAIVNPANGLQIYNTTTSAINFYNGSSWVAVGTGTGTVTSVSGTANQIGVATGATTPVISLVSGGTLPGNWLLGTPASATLTNATGLPEGGLSLTDITTANTSTSAHGFFPKLTSNSLYYVNNAGALTALTVGAAGTVLTGNGVTSAPTWAASSSGLAPATTAISPTVTGSILMDIGGTLTESISYRAQQATPFGTAFGFEAHSSASFSGVNNTSFGYQAGKANTTGQDNTYIGYRAGHNLSTVSYNTYIGSGATNNGSNCTFIGYNSGLGANASSIIAIGTSSANYAGQQSIFIGNSTGTNSGGCTYSTVIGHNSNTGYGRATSIVIGYGLLSAQNTANNQGFLGSNDANGYISNWFFNGQTHATAPYPVILNASSAVTGNGASMTIQGGAGGGTDKNAGGLVLSSNTSTGTGTGTVTISTPTAAGTGTGVNAVITRLTINGTRITSTLPIKTAGYTVATLPAGSVGDIAYVTDATAPTYLGALVGGGGVTTPVFYNGAAWVSY